MKITVIIPVYNAEKYIEKTINSVINQTINFNEIELILIDDNSTDKSKKIIESYSKQYENIIPIYLNENHGNPGYGRNIGIKKSTTDYIMFLDNDDEYTPDICGTLYQTIQKTNSDLVDCEYVLVDNFTKPYTISTDTYNIKTINNDIIYFPNIGIWTKIFKKSIITNNNITFITDDVNEDSLFCIEYFMHCKTINFLPDYIGYKHFIHGSNLSTVTSEYTYKMLKSYYNILKLVNENSTEHDLERLFYERIQTTIERCILMNDFTFKSLNHILKEYIPLKNKLISIPN